MLGLFLFLVMLLPMQSLRADKKDVCLGASAVTIVAAIFYINYLHDQIDEFEKTQSKNTKKKKIIVKDTIDLVKEKFDAKVKKLYYRHRAWWHSIQARFFGYLARR